ncbi:MAG: hypothetical protein ABJQ71_20060 [Roseibium sp.]
MGIIRIASFNIEKNGQSSDPLKQVKVADFIAICVDLGIEVVFLCEVHSARIGDYVDFLRAVYGGIYRVEFLAGGHSNAYVFLVRHDLGAFLSYDGLLGLNRNLFLFHIEGEIAIGFAHFKSGQTGLTKSQIQNAAGFLQDITNNTGRWAIAGDINWDLSNFGDLTLPAYSSACSCWPDMTQKHGNILDWCVAGSSVAIDPVSGPDFFPAEFQVMDGPDHRPCIFALVW